MMNDRVIYELLYNFLLNHPKRDVYLEKPREAWQGFWINTQYLDGHYKEIYFLIQNIIKEQDRKDKLKCQYCRIDEGLLVEPPVRCEDLCKKHRQEYEEQYVDRTKTKRQVDISDIKGKEGFNCSSNSRKIYYR